MGLFPLSWEPRAEEKGPHLSRWPREPFLLWGWPTIEPPLFQLCYAFLGLELGGFLEADLVTCGRRPMNECLFWSSNFHFEELPPFPYLQSGCNDAHIMGMLGGSAETTHAEQRGRLGAQSAPAMGAVLSRSSNVVVQRKVQGKDLFTRVCITELLTIAEGRSLTCPWLTYSYHGDQSLHGNKNHDVFFYPVFSFIDGFESKNVDTYEKKKVWKAMCQAYQQCFSLGDIKGKKLFFA